MILAGDFNSTIDKHGSTSQNNTSRALATLIRGCDLFDVWDTTQNRTGYTYSASNTASIIDGIYVLKRLYSRKTGVERVATAFTNHLAVVLRLVIDAPLPIRGRSYWRMNSSLLQSEALGKETDDQWHTCAQHKRHYNNCVTWWEKYVKNMLRQLFIKQGTSRRRALRQMEDFYYRASYDALEEERKDETTIIALKRLKAKIVNLYSVNKKRLLIDAGEQYTTMDEEPTIYHLLKQWKRQTSRMVIWILDADETVQKSATGILPTFATYMRNKYDTLAVNDNQIRDPLAHMKTRLPPETNADLEAPITMDKMEMVVRQGKNAKTPGHDGISHDFLKHKWKTIRHDLLQILNDVYVGKDILHSQTHGIIVCVPKKIQPVRPHEYRALMLLNADFKLLSRILANRLKKWRKDLLHSS